jgi:ferritin
MVTKKVEKALNEQIGKEEHSSRLYLAMASWCQRNGYQGAADLLYVQTEEERLHMLKLIHYLNDRGGAVVHGAMEPISTKYKSMLEVFQKVLHHEEFISESINQLYGVCNEEKDFTTAHYLQWYINEQIEEESTARGILDKIKLAGEHQGGLFLIDKEFASMAVAKRASLAASAVANKAT